jgi:Right handed beta helix region
MMPGARIEAIWPYPTKPSGCALLLESVICAALLLPAAHAANVARIDQASALAGNVTPGDAPGFPITISRPGSYRLTGDLRVPAGMSGIEVEAPEVVLDLNGHTLSGPLRCAQNKSPLAVRCDAALHTQSHSGIRSATDRIVIRNGSVSGFARAGLDLSGNAVVEDLQVHSNAGAGIVFTSAHTTPGELRDVRVSNNAGAGIVCDRVHIVRSIFEANGGAGVGCRRSWFNASESRHNAAQGVTGGSKFGLRSHANRQPDDFGAAVDRLPAMAADRNRRTPPPP